MTIRRELPPVATCIGCNCTDLQACAGSCSWLMVDRERQVGVCSSCDHMRPAWNRAVRNSEKSGMDFLDFLKFEVEKLKGAKP